METNTKNLSLEEKEKICKKFKANDYSLSYLGCNPECPFMCPEPCMCMFDGTKEEA